MAHPDEWAGDAVCSEEVDSDGIPRLPVGHVDILLSHARVVRKQPDLAYLRELQWAWLCAQPFHNLDLLAGARDGTAPVSAWAALERTLMGLGGPCHVHAVSMAALLRGLGFSTHLAAATISAPGDHLVNLVIVEGRRWVCDVGNGHPYVRPFPLDRPLVQERCGWRFLSEPRDGGLRLRRFFADGSEKLVYTVDPAPRVFSDFARIIEAHHRRPGFGPFLTGLRAVRMHPRVVLTLRDATYQRYTRLGAITRPVRDEAACVRLLEGPFQLAGLPIAEALDVLRANRASPWPDAVLAIDSAKRPMPRAVYSVATTDRPAGLRRLGASIVADLGRSRFAPRAAGTSEPCPVTFVVIENSNRPENRNENRRVVDELRACGLSVHYEDAGRHGRSIAESRVAQRDAMARLWRRGLRPDFVWMLDDDMVLSRYVRDPEGPSLRSDVAYLDTWWRLLCEHPEISVTIAPTTGDPPIPLVAMVRTQLQDLLANLERFAGLQPEDIYPAAGQSALYALPDYYYDHSRAGSDHLDAVFAWEVDRAFGPSVRAQFSAMMHRAMRLDFGCAITRPRLADRSRVSLTPTRGTLRGGNTAFFDVDACLFSVYPSVKLSDVRTRRSDMTGAAILDTAGVWPVWHLGPAVHHLRDVATSPASDGGFANGDTNLDRRRTRALCAMRAEFYGVLLARTFMEPPADTSDEALGEHLRILALRRSARIIANLAMAGTHADALVELLGDRTAFADWWRSDESIVRRLASAHAMVLELRDRLLGGATAESRSAWHDRLRAALCEPASIRAVLEAYRSIPVREREAHEYVLALLGEKERVGTGWREEDT